MAIRGFLIAAVVSWVVGLAMIYLGPRVGFVDRPDNDLKTHRQPVPPLGGVGVFAGLMLGLWAAGAFDMALLAATALMFVVGLVDDRRGLSPAVRIVAALAAGVLLVLLSDVPGGWATRLFWVAAVVAVVNAVNLLDGLDGLAGSTALAAVAGLWAYGVESAGNGPHFYLVTIGALIGFLGLNWPPARVFFGDNGAYVAAVTLVWLALRSAPDRSSSLVAVALIGVPLLDLAATVVRRLFSGRSLTSGDRDHTYDLLARRGWPVSRVVFTFVFAQVVWMVGLFALATTVSDLTAAAVAVVSGLLLAILVPRLLPAVAPAG